MDPVNVALWCCIIALLIRRYVKSGHEWKKFNVPFDPPVILFGNVIDYYLRRKTKGEVTRQLYNKYPGERFIGFYQVKRSGVIVTQPEDIKRVLVTNFDHFQDRTDFDFDEKELYSNLITARSQKWRGISEKVSPAFGADNLKNMVPLVVEVSENFSEYLAKIVDEEVEFGDVMARFTADVVGSLGYGLRINSVQDDASSFRIMGQQVLRFSTWKMLKIILKQFVPYLYELFEVKLQDDDEKSFFMNVVKDVEEERVRTNKNRNDFIDLFLKIKNKYDETDDFVAKQAFLLMIGGFDTSTTLMTFTLYELAINVDVQDKVYSEIESVMSKHDEKLSYDLISEMQYLEMVVNEVQRMHPALENLERICTSSYTFPDSSVTLEVGDSVTIPVMAIHHDSKYYKEPEKFDPNRFDPETKSVYPMTYLPYGEGPRRCLGLRLGKMQSIIGLITVLREFRVETCSRTPQNIVLDPKSLVGAAKEGIWLKLKKRS